VRRLLNLPAALLLMGLVAACDAPVAPTPDQPAGAQESEADEPGDSAATDGSARESEATPPSAAEHVDNPYAGDALGYINPEWKAKAESVAGGERVSDTPTGVWLDRIAAIDGTDNSSSNGTMGLRDHLDAALEQGADYAQFVIYNLPGRDCSALASNGELGPDDPAYRELKIVTVIEIDSLPNLVTNANVEMCARVQANGAYVEGVRYALDTLHAITNVYTYVDAAHHAWIGWESNFGPTADLFAEVVSGTADGFDSVDGFITNTANYSALEEPFLDPTGTVGGQEMRQSDWIDFNPYVDELSFAQAFRDHLVSVGFNGDLGMLIDTSRNGWGGDDRPTEASTSTDLNTYVNESRVDRRIHAGNWCNQSGAGLGERPTAEPEPGIDAYVWIKPPGESDGSSELIPNDEGKGFDRMCDPEYQGNERNGNNPTGALPNAPISGAWFPEQFQELMANAHPAL
jgi:cellulose 1,4-beta-cellobiosidase